MAILERHALEAIALDANLSPELMEEVCLWAQTKKIPGTITCPSFSEVF